MTKIITAVLWWLNQCRQVVFKEQPAPSWLKFYLFPSRYLSYARVSASTSAWKWFHRRVPRNWKDCRLHHFDWWFVRIFKYTQVAAIFKFVCWGIKILLWPVNTDQNLILITSTNYKIVVTNQFHLCNGIFSWKF